MGGGWRWLALGVYDSDGNRVSEIAGGVTTKYLVDTLIRQATPRCSTSWSAVQ